MSDVPRRVALAIAAAAAAAVLHLAAAPAHLPELEPPAALAHGRRHHPPAAPSTATPDRSPTVPLRGTGGRPEPAVAAGLPPPAATAPDRDALVLGWLFVAAGVFGLAIAGRLLLRPAGRLVWLVIAAGHLAMLAAGVASRTTGLLGHLDPWWDVAFLLAVVAEVAVVAIAAGELAAAAGWRLAPTLPPRGTRRWA